MKVLARRTRYVVNDEPKMVTDPPWQREDNQRKAREAWRNLEAFAEALDKLEQCG